MQQALDTDELDTPLPVYTGGDVDWFSQSTTTYDGADEARSGPLNDEENDVSSQMEILVEGEGLLKFWWKVESESGDELQFLLDGQLKLCFSIFQSYLQLTLRFGVYYFLVDSFVKTNTAKKTCHSK